MGTEPWKNKQIVKDELRQFVHEGDDFLAIFISWDHAVEFCRKLTEMERNAGRLPERWEFTLPTEAQWERACRARSTSKYSFGDDESELGEYAWFAGNTENEQYAHQVGRKKPNPWGLGDMHGNVGEWCRDWYSEKLPGGRDPEVTSKASKYRVIRGGSRSFDAARCRSGFRLRDAPSDAKLETGLRVALSAVRR